MLNECAIHVLLSFYKDCFGIKYPMNVDMPIKQRIQTKYKHLIAIIDSTLFNNVIYLHYKYYMQNIIY